MVEALDAAAVVGPWLVPVLAAVGLGVVVWIVWWR